MFVKEFFSPVVGHAQNKASRWLLRCRLDCSSLDAHETGILKGMLIYMPKLALISSSRGLQRERARLQ